MASPTENPNRYTPENPPAGEPTTSVVIEWAMRQFRLLSSLTDMLSEGQIEETRVAPTKPRNGMIRLADGTSWNPGAGRGVYWFDGNSATWKLLG